MIHLTGNTIRLPEEWCRRPIFPAVPNGQPVRLRGADENQRPFLLDVGAVDKMSKTDATDALCPSIGIDHAILLMTYLRGFAARGDITQNHFSPSFNWLWRDFTGSEHAPNAVQMKWFKRLQADWDVMRIRVWTNSQTSEAVNAIDSETEHALLGSSGILAGSRFKKIRVHPLLMQAAFYANPTCDIRFDVLRSFHRAVSRAAYLWLPALAFHNSARKPFELWSETLAEKLGMPPTSRSIRLKKLGLRPDCAQPPFSDLDGAPMRNENRLRVAFEPAGKGDYKLLAWAEGPTGGPVRKSGEVDADSRLYAEFIKGGGTPELYARKTASLPPLNDDETRLLRQALGDVRNRSIPPEEIAAELRDNLDFFRKAKGLLGPVKLFDILADGKVFAEGGEQVTVSLGSRLRTVVLNDLSGKLTFGA